MRKKIIGGFAVLAIAAVAAWNMNINNNNSLYLSDISLENMEALANENEHVVGLPGTNWKIFTITCTYSTTNSNTNSTSVGISAGIGAGPGGSVGINVGVTVTNSTSQTTNAEWTTSKEVCGKGAGLCYGGTGC